VSYIFIRLLPVPFVPLMAPKIIEREHGMWNTHDDEVGCNNVLKFFPDITTYKQFDEECDYLHDPDCSSENRGCNDKPPNSSVPRFPERRLECVEIGDDHLYECIQRVPNEQRVALTPPIEWVDHHPQMKQKERQECDRDRKTPQARAVRVVADQIVFGLVSEDARVLWPLVVVPLVRGSNVFEIPVLFRSHANVT
jgi:hypothetical protein